MASTTEEEGGLRKVYKDHNLHVLFGVTLIAVLGVSSITPAFPRIRDALGITTGEVGLLILPAILFGAAQSLNLPNVFSLLSSHAPTENRGAFMSVNVMTLRAGQTLGPLLMAASSASPAPSSPPQPSPPQPSPPSPSSSSFPDPLTPQG